MKDEKTCVTPNERISGRLGMSLKEFQETVMSAGDGPSAGRLGMSVEAFRNITTKTE